MKKMILIIMLVLSGLVSICGLLGVYQAIYLFGSGPNFSQDRFNSNMEVWGAVTSIGIGLLIYLIWRLRREKKQSAL